MKTFTPYIRKEKFTAIRFMAHDDFPEATRDTNFDLPDGRKYYVISKDISKTHSMQLWIGWWIVRDERGDLRTCSDIDFHANFVSDDGKEKS